MVTIKVFYIKNYGKINNEIFPISVKEEYKYL